MKIIYICIGEPLTGKTTLADSLNKQIEVIDDYVPDFVTNMELVEHINYVKDRDAIFFIVCSEYSPDLILTLEQYLIGKYKVILCENTVIIDKGDVETWN